MSDKPVYSAQPPQVEHQTGPQRGPNDSYPPEDEIDLRELFGLLWAGRVLICRRDRRRRGGLGGRRAGR